MFDSLHHFICKVQKEFDLFSIFFDDHRIIGNVILIGSIVVFTQPLRSAFYPVFCHRIMPVGSQDFQFLKIQIMAVFPVFPSIDHINRLNPVFQDILIVLPTEDIIYKI